MNEKQLKEFLKSMERVRKLHATTHKKARKFLKERRPYRFRQTYASL